jgi:uncharacterized DUF497 family protein
MVPLSFLWDLDDDPNGYVLHCARHCITKTEVEEAFRNVVDVDSSESSGRLVVFGDTEKGRHLLVVFEEAGDETVYVVTAYEVRRRYPR